MAFSDKEVDAFWQRLFRDAGEDIMPKMMKSAFVLGVMQDPDIYLALQIGLALVLDKPLILFIPDGLWLAPRLRALAYAVIDGDLSDPRVQEKARVAIDAIIDKKKEPVS